MVISYQIPGRIRLAESKGVQPVGAGKSAISIARPPKIVDFVLNAQRFLGARKMRHRRRSRCRKQSGKSGEIRRIWATKSRERTRIAPFPSFLQGPYRSHLQCLSVCSRKPFSSRSDLPISRNSQRDKRPDNAPVRCGRFYAHKALLLL